jgi:hypothetical protein
VEGGGGVGSLIADENCMPEIVDVPIIIDTLVIDIDYMVLMMMMEMAPREQNEALTFSNACNCVLIYYCPCLSLSFFLCVFCTK